MRACTSYPVEKVRESFLSVFLHEKAHAKFQAAALQPSTSKVLPPVRSSTLGGAFLEVKYGFDELRVDTQALEWLHFVGNGIIMDRLFKLHDWQFSGGFDS